MNSKIVRSQPNPRLGSRIIAHMKPSSSSLGIVRASEGGSVEKKESLLRWKENEDTMIRETNPSKSVFGIAVAVIVVV